MGNCKCIENFDFLNELNLKSEEKEEYSKPKHKTTLRSNRTIEETPAELEDDANEVNQEKYRTNEISNEKLQNNENKDDVNSPNPKITNIENNNSEIKEEEDINNDLFKIEKLQSRLEIQPKFDKKTSFLFGMNDEPQIENKEENYEDINNDNFTSNDFDNFEGDLEEFVKRALKEHNRYREMHNVPPLKEDKKITKIAQSYAEFLAENNMFQHSENNFSGEALGENIFFGIKINPEAMTSTWYNEIKNYNFDYPTEKNCSKVGHFTQIVWKETRTVGFGFAKSKEGYYYGVANYYPAGNVMDQFEKNVLPKNQNI